MLPHPFTNFEIHRYYRYKFKFNDVSSRDNLPNEIKDGAYIINVDEYADVGTHWIALYVPNSDATYFDSFGVEHIPKAFKNFLGNKNITTNIFRIQAYDLIMCRYFCFGFIDYMLTGKTLIDYTSLFSPHDFKKNEKIILSYSKNG